MTIKKSSILDYILRLLVTLLYFYIKILILHFGNMELRLIIHFFRIILWSLIFFHITQISVFFLFGENDPIVLVVIIVAVAGEKILEHVFHGAVLRALVEPQIPALAEVLGELDGVPLAEDLDGGGELLLFDHLVLFALVAGLESLPGQHPPQEVHNHVADALHVVPAR
jgi:hypothetical protein